MDLMVTRTRGGFKLPLVTGLPGPGRFAAPDGESRMVRIKTLMTPHYTGAYPYNNICGF